jgi:outer membrane protein TolC
MMTMHAWIRMAPMAVVLAVPVGVSAQAMPPPDALMLTLEEAIARGLESSHRVEEIGARGEAADAVIRQRRAGAQPQVSAQAGYTRTNHVDEFGLLTPDGQLRVIYPDVPDNLRARLDVQWPVYTGGRQEAVARAARIEASALAIDRDVLLADLRLEITRAYWTFVTAIESSRVLEDALLRTDAHLVDARNMLEAGLVAPNDVLTVEAQQARQRMLRIRADAQRDGLEAELARLVGAPPESRIRPASTLDAAPASLGGSAMAVDVLMAEARRSRRDRAALVERLGAAGARRDVAAAGLRPTIALGAGVDYARPNPRIFPRREVWEPSWDASVGVSWPIADGGRVRAEMAEAAAAARALEARLAEFDGILDVEIRQRVNDLAATRAAIGAAEAGVRAATEARRVAADRFAAGVATNTDVLVAQGALLQAALDRTEALASARLAEARLMRALGR